MCGGRPQEVRRAEGGGVGQHQAGALRLRQREALQRQEHREARQAHGPRGGEQIYRFTVLFNYCFTV